MKPILFKTDMIKAILEGRKTITRRILNPQPSDYGFFNEPLWLCGSNGVWCDGYGWQRKCPYGQIGDKLYVRETFCNADIKLDTCDKLCFKASVRGCRHANYEKSWPSWKPSIFMPKTVARIFLEITNIRVERVQDITEEDSIKEGVDFVSMKSVPRQATMSRKSDFKQLWDSINSKRGYSWESNPWVWVIEFKRVEE
jgi:hypothetical protein